MKRAVLGEAFVFALILLVLGGARVTAQVLRSVWPVSGHDLSNTRYQPDERILSPETVGRLSPKWIFRTGGSVSATPAVDEDSVYVPDWSGKIFRIDRETGQEVWRRDVSDITGVPFDFARATPAVASDRLVFGDQAGNFREGARVIALDKQTGGTLWVSEVDDHPSAMITQSAVVYDGRVYVGVSSLEEAHAALIRGYVCCSFRGSVLALDLETGRILWKTHTAPDVAGYGGNAVWGSSPVVDASRRSLYVTTGNNYSVPQALEDCIATARSSHPEDEAAVRLCVNNVPGNYFDAILALDLDTGAVKWARSALPFDAWTVSCAFGLVNPGNCPSPSGPDHDFGQGPVAVHRGRRSRRPPRASRERGRRAESIGPSIPKPETSSGRRRWGRREESAG